MGGLSVPDSPTEFQLVIQNVALASQYLKLAGENIDKAFSRFSDMPDGEIEATEYDTSRFITEMNHLSDTCAYFLEVLERWEQWEESLEVSTEPSEPSLTDTSSPASSKRPGTSSFEPELEPGSFET